MNIHYSIALHLFVTYNRSSVRGRISKKNTCSIFSFYQKRLQRIKKVLKKRKFYSYIWYLFFNEFIQFVY